MLNKVGLVFNIFRKDSYHTVRLWLYAGTVLALILLTFRNWFFESSILTQGDWSYYTDASLRTFRLMYFHVWLSDIDFGRTLIDVGQAPSYAMYGVIAKWFGLGYPYSERLIHMVPAVLLAPTSTYMLLRLFTKRLFSISAGMAVFCCNTYFLQLLTGDITIATAYSVAPLVLYAFIKHFRKPTLKSGVVAGLVSVLMCSYEPRVFFVEMLAVLIYLACIILFTEERRVVFSGVRGCFITSVPFILIALLCFYWLIGLFMSGGENDTSVLSNNLFGNEFFILQNALTIDQPFWTGSRPQSFIYHTIQINEWIIPIGLLLSLYINRAKKIAFYAAVLVIVGVLLGKQESEPFSALYLWLFTHAPGFNAFREASKFYLLVALGSAILLTLLVDKLLTEKKYETLNIIFALIVIFMLLINLKPFITGSIGTTITAKSIPTAYIKWNAFIEKQPSFSRVLWFPMKSRWADDTPLHPDVRAATVINDAWKGIYQSNPAYMSNGVTQPDEQRITSIYAMSVAQELMKESSIKYIVVPIRDKSEVDDVISNYGNDRNYYLDTLSKLSYLKMLNMHMDGLVVYENELYKPYIRSATSLNLISTTTNIDNAYKFVTNQSKETNFNFTINNTNKPRSLPANGVQDIFNNLGLANFTKEDTLNPSIEKLGNETSFLYAATNRPELSYQVTGQSLLVYETNPNKLLVNNHPVGVDSPRRIIYSKRLDSSKRYYIGEGKALIDTGQLSSGNINSQNGQVGVFSTNNQNLVPDSSFEDGLWQKRVEDCNDYDGQYGIGMDMGLDSSQATVGHSSLRLTTLDHTACTTSNPIPVLPGNNYRFSFDYKDYLAKYSGYTLSFNNRAATSITEQIQQNVQWSTYSRIIKVPNGATDVTIRLIGYPEESANNFASTYYDNVILSQMSLESNINVDMNPEYTKLPVNSATSITYKDSSYSFTNLIPNPSFENGLWQKRVGDCDNYDNSPEINMSLDTGIASNGNKSLELDATRHIACTNTNPINVTGNSKLYLSFDYESLDETSAHYSLTFNDPSHTLYAQSVQIPNKRWNSYSTILTVPEGATQVTLGVSTIPSGSSSGAKTTVQYDNFRLMAIPNVQDSYFLVNQPERTFTEPKNISFTIVNPTERLVKISGANSSFYLNMSETYNNRWQLEMNNNKVHKLDSWLPIARPDAVLATDHYKLDDYANGWYVNVDELCNQEKLCTRNSDGSYNLYMEIEFTSQRWMNAGMLVSGVTFVSCIGYIGHNLYKRRKVHEEEKARYVAHR